MIIINIVISEQCSCKMKYRYMTLFFRANDIELYVEIICVTCGKNISVRLKKQSWQISENRELSRGFGFSLRATIRNDHDRIDRKNGEGRKKDARRKREREQTRYRHPWRTLRSRLTTIVNTSAIRPSLVEDTERIGKGEGRWIDRDSEAKRRKEDRPRDTRQKGQEGAPNRAETFYEYRSLT